MVQIREACMDDLDELLALLPQMSSRPASPGVQMPPREVAETILAQICADKCAKLLVAVDGSTQDVLGTLILIIIANLTYGGKPWALIENVVVAQAHRRQGIGEQLIQAAIRRARDAGCYKVQLISGTKGEQIAFYQHLGFQSKHSIGHKLYL